MRTAPWIVLAILACASAAGADPAGADPAGADPAGDYTFDAASGEILVRTDRGGLLGFAGHRHVIRAESFEGRLTWPAGSSVPSALEVRIDAASLVVADEDLDAGDVAKVQATMERDVLEVEAWPLIVFTGRRVGLQGDELRVTGSLSLHGVEREVTLPLAFTREGGRIRLSGELSVRQKDYGIHPVSAGLGAVKVKDAVRVELRIEALPSPAGAPLDADGRGSAR